MSMEKEKAFGILIVSHNAVMWKALYKIGKDLPKNLGERRVIFKRMFIMNIWQDSRLPTAAQLTLDATRSLNVRSQDWIQQGRDIIIGRNVSKVEILESWLM